MRVDLNADTVLVATLAGVATIAVTVACVLLSIELQWVAPVWVPWALVGLSVGLGVLLARLLGGTAPRALSPPGISELEVVRRVAGRVESLLDEAHSRQPEVASVAAAQRLAPLVCGLELLQVALRQAVATDAPSDPSDVDSVLFVMAEGELEDLRFRANEESPEQTRTGTV